MADLTASPGAERALRAAEDPDDILHANEAFIRQIFAMAHSPRLSSFSRLMTGIIPGNFFALVPGTIQSQKHGIAAVNRAVKAGNGAKASQDFVRLLRDHGELVVHVLQSRDILWNPQD